MKLSIVVPVYNSEATIRPLVETIFKSLFEYEVEIVLVNDGSKDKSPQIANQIARADSRVTAITLRKNFGEHNAVMCGLNYATGDVVAIIDDDLQNPPAEIPKLLNELNLGYDVVFARYQDKQHHWFRNLGSWFTNKMATMLLSKPKDLYLASFKIIRREVVDQIIRYQGPSPYIDGLILRVTNNFSTALVEHKEREVGTSNYNFRRLVKLYLTMFLNFSILPLRFFTVLGFAISALSIIFAGLTLVEWSFTSTLPKGYASLFTAVLFLSGIQLMFVGLLGEYLGRMYFTINGSPQYIVKSVVAQETKLKKVIGC